MFGVNAAVINVLTTVAYYAHLQVISSIVPKEWNIWVSYQLQSLGNWMYLFSNIDQYELFQHNVLIKEQIDDGIKQAAKEWFVIYYGKWNGRILGISWGHN